jgi:hypothetical protein
VSRTYHQLTEEDVVALDALFQLRLAMRAASAPPLPSPAYVTTAQAVKEDPFYTFKVWRSVHGEETAREMCRLASYSYPAKPISNRERMNEQ